MTTVISFSKPVENRAALPTGAIPVLSFSPIVQTTPKKGERRVKVQEIAVLIQVKDSVLFQQAVLSGKVFSTISLMVFDDETGFLSLSFLMRDVLVTQFSVTGSTGTNSTTSADMTLSTSRMKVVGDGLNANKRKKR